MPMTKRVLKPKTITVDDYYSERFMRIEVEMKHQRELMLIGFENMNKRFEAVDKRFEEMREDINRRFETVDRRFEALTKRIDRFMIWSFGITISTTGIIIAAMKLWK